MNGATREALVIKTEDLLPLLKGEWESYDSLCKATNNRMQRTIKNIWNCQYDYFGLGQVDSLLVLLDRVEWMNMLTVYRNPSVNYEDLMKRLGCDDFAEEVLYLE